MEFKVGDRVKMGPLWGRVEYSQPDCEPYPRNTKVRWDEGEQIFFTHDGRIHHNHTTPVLELMERPKRKVKRTVWVNFIKDQDEAHPRAHWYSSKEIAEGTIPMFGPRLATAVPIEIEVEE